MGRWRGAPEGRPAEGLPSVATGDFRPLARANPPPSLESEVGDMRLTGKDFIGTLLAAAAILVALDVTNAWGWPVINGYRAGVIALTVIGFGMCSAASDYSTVRWTNPLVLIAVVLG